MTLDEKERKFLLKRKPDIQYHHTIHIIQYYSDGWRYRMEQEFSKPPYYVKLKKVKIGEGHNKEVNIEEIDAAAFYTNRKIGNREIKKTRHVHIVSDKLKYEVDVFENNLCMVMMEIEVEDFKTELSLPKEIEDLILLEVTGNEKFDNYNLAL